MANPPPCASNDPNSTCKSHRMPGDYADAVVSQAESVNAGDNHNLGASAKSAVEFLPFAQAE